MKKTLFTFLENEKFALNRHETHCIVSNITQTHKFIRNSTNYRRLTKILSANDILTVITQKKRHTAANWKFFFRINYSIYWKLRVIFSRLLFRRDNGFLRSCVILLSDISIELCAENIWIVNLEWIINHRCESIARFERKVD